LTRTNGADDIGADLFNPARQLRRRREAANRCEPLGCGKHRDPLDHLPAPLNLNARSLAAWRAARDHLAEYGYRAILPAPVARRIGEAPDRDAA
jgi:hypothetical protein